MNVLENFKNLFADVWNKGVSGINISEIIIALTIFIFFLFLRGVFSKFVVKRLEKYVSKTTNKFDNSLVFSMEGPAKFFPIVLGFFVSTSYLTVEHGAIDLINRSLITILIFWTFHQIIGPLSVVIKSHVNPASKLLYIPDDTPSSSKFHAFLSFSQLDA